MIHKEKEVWYMINLFERYDLLVSEVKEECQRNGLDFRIVKRIEESTPWTLMESFNYCLRKKEESSEWHNYQMDQTRIRKRK